MNMAWEFRMLESPADKRRLRLVLFAGALIVSAAITPTASWAGRIKHPRAIFAGLDKITGRTIAFEAAAGETVQFGTLQITERACFTRPATEAPQTETFVEVDEVGAGKNYKQIFSGWMFAASPGLHGIEHPIYDVWLTGCEGEGTLEAGLEAAAPSETKPAEQERVPAPLAKSPRRHVQPGRNSPEGGEGQVGTLQDQQPEAELPPLGEPVEVRPPPGFIPVPQSRRKPAQRYYPAGPGVDLDNSDGVGDNSDGADGF
jgi:hypothetical protein